MELLFNIILDKGDFPTSWTVGIIIPIYKHGDIHDTDNYRGITLLSVFGNVFTYIVKKR